MLRVLTIHKRVAMMRRRQQRNEITKRIIAQYFEPCPWCKKDRPGKEPNMVEVKMPGSHGICQECLAIEKAELERMFGKKKE